MIKYQIVKITHSFVQLIKTQNVQKILIAFSGGQDSILLISIINKLMNTKIMKPIQVSYIYIDHQWKKSSYKQIKHIISYIKSTSNKIYVYQIKNTILSEETCRKYRNHIIIQHSKKYNYDLILTGHSLTDKVETFIHSLIRGSGIESFNSLNIRSNLKNDTTIFRPLITINRNTIYWICKKLRLPIWSDKTNYINKMERNRIRQELIPYLKNYMNKNLENKINHLINNYLYENDYIKQNVIKLYLKYIHKNKIAIKYTELKKQNIIIQIRTIQLFGFHNFQIYINHQEVMQIINIIKRIIKKPTQIYQKSQFQFIANKKWIYIKLN